MKTIELNEQQLEFLINVLSSLEENQLNRTSKLIMDQIISKLEAE